MCFLGNRIYAILWDYATKNVMFYRGGWVGYVIFNLY